MMTTERAQIAVNQLLKHAESKLSLKAEDRIYILNALLDLLSLPSPAAETPEYSDVQTEVIDVLVDYAIEKGITTPEERILFETKMMGLVTPMPSAVTAEFEKIKEESGVEAATDWLYELSKSNDYLRMCDINKNIKWRHNGKFGDIEVTINLSKPEKDPKQIALALKQPKSGYPACMLCPSNLGYAGNLNHPARQTLRFVPVTLTNESWHLQFSPYQYYTKHIIVFSDEHRPMTVCEASLKRLLEFTDKYPHYFLGSNAALPIVGGSILTHDHYQGGGKVLPMFDVGTRAKYSSKEFPEVKIEIVNWYNSVVRVSGRSEEKVHAAATKVLSAWKGWSDESVEIIAKTTAEHNAITPIARKENGVYIMDMILRNNRTDERRPYGIFHPEERLHNIKKEGIGIIEVMGLFILPGRLKKELEEVEEFLTGERKADDKSLSDENSSVYKHRGMISELLSEHGSSLSKEEAAKAVTMKVNGICEQILEYTAVFKNNEKGQKAFDRFMTEGLGLERM